MMLVDPTGGDRKNEPEEDFDRQLFAWLLQGCDRDAKKHLAELIVLVNNRESTKFEA